MSARSSSGRQPARIDRLRPCQSNSSKSVELFCQAKREAILPGIAENEKSLRRLKPQRLLGGQRRGEVDAFELQHPGLR
ncbi:hypothetical protein ELI00_24710 [Rhizobium ruizarguesonis]|nr:hypothetical protein [Rhizobium leguminosarum bv. viciae]NKQ74327.1 hypothetical protein [Rhizobium ruizarguesonis]NKQ79429.1 hypothetical protein [Rhizobium ruizarguesonis]TAU29201.1 hypothetical protein ELI48_25235 [Rhizobium ruizarguesonis]TAU71201.1 hypothetical protein ELI45_26870 [Rhizobium ruizarguesonis]